MSSLDKNVSHVERLRTKILQYTVLC